MQLYSCSIDARIAYLKNEGALNFWNLVVIRLRELHSVFLLKRLLIIHYKAPAVGIRIHVPISLDYLVSRGSPQLFVLKEVHIAYLKNEGALNFLHFVIIRLRKQHPCFCPRSCWSSIIRRQLLISRLFSTSLDSLVSGRSPWKNWPPANFLSSALTAPQFMCALMVILTHRVVIHASRAIVSHCSDKCTRVPVQLPDN